MIISRTPLRMSFVGGGSDFKDYYMYSDSASVISTTINKYVYITINKKFDEFIRVGYSKLENVKHVDDIGHNLVREALKLVGITKSIDIVYMSDMLLAHEGSGLGASSSLVAGTLNALHAYKEEYVSAETLAKEACKIEIEILGHPIGKQDQYAAAYGGFNHIQFNSDESVFVNQIIFKKETKEKLNKNLLLFYTNINTRSDAILTEQKNRIKENRHVLDKMIGLSKELRKALEKNNLADFGHILHEGWMHKQKLASKIANAAINSYYKKAIEAGAIGGKILGSGGGGFLLFYCEKENQDNVRTALSDLKEVSFKFEPQGSKIIYVSD